MKRANLLLLLLPLLFVACKQKSETDASATKTDSVTYAYNIKKPDNWDINTNQANTQTALKGLKDYEKGDTADMRTLFADSVSLSYDGGKYKGPIKQFLVMAKSERDSCKALTITVHDWESVISKDKKDEWVTLWYDETVTDLKGKTDSAAIVNDTQYKNGKVIRMDVYRRGLK